MPIVRYFVFVGGILLALLFAADRYLPSPVVRTDKADLDRTTIRIRSARSLPEKIVFDMRPRTDIPAVTAAEPIPEERRASAREALAAMPAPSEVKVEPHAGKRVEARPKRKRWAKLPRKSPEPRLAFDRQDAFAGSWW
ncbi:hypothetical protein [Bradyrhizobium sp. Gha]|uniref:hypothetical protein n=1 Tax=Bradyrhizobium sp. Gha TaxID=1855318 RepID=UPI0008EE11ED|nr:hypothetical protein [Bradyrhizobium sp. Gha]SFJ72865.1 hypothetical protein SAMN05216525_13365 [Bradyrhizobium sp. Gha]